MVLLWTKHLIRIFVDIIIMYNFKIIWKSIQSDLYFIKFLQFKYSLM